MKQFIVKIILFSFAAVIALIIPLTVFDTGYDPFYKRFTTPKQTSLILGSSRSAQGINPKIVNEYLNRNDLFNYSFTKGTSPYGECYLNSIKRKLDTTSNKRGVFILGVDPWTISSFCKKPEDTLIFKEQSGMISCPWVNMKPNLLYLLKYNKTSLVSLFWINKETYLHENGWLEITVSMEPQHVQKRLKRKVEMYLYDLKYHKISQTRISYLEETVRFLKRHGDVYLVRIPAHDKIYDIEQSYMSNFDEVIKNISVKTNVPYLNLMEKRNEFEYTDGNHVARNSAAKLSSTIADWIKSNKK